MAESSLDAVDTLAWSPDGRWLAYQSRAASGLTRTGIFEAHLGRRARHPVVDWLERSDRSVMVQGWIDPGRLRVLVAPGSEPRGGLAYAWQADGGTFAVEAQLEPLAAHAPPGGRLEPGGVFSLDLAGDPAPETVALYRTPDGAPSAVVLESRESGYGAVVTAPLIPAAALGLESWEGAGGAALHLVTVAGGRTTLLLRLPSAEPPLRALGLFQAAPGGGLEVVTATGPSGTQPAVFYDGRSGGVAVELGLVDLDEDGSDEVVSATGRMVAGPPSPSVSWRASVFRWSGGQLVPAPDLEAAALERLARLTAAP